MKASRDARYQAPNGQKNRVVCYHDCVPPFDLQRIDGLFHEPRIFDSADRLMRAGFEVLKDTRPGKIIVFARPDFPEVIFKKYANDTSPGEQLDNYRDRLRGAEALDGLIASRQLRHILVPHKHLHELPKSFALRKLRKKHPSYVLICERMHLLPRKKNKDRYQADIDEDVLRELCLVVSRFRALDSGFHNMPFTTSGKASMPSR